MENARWSGGGLNLDTSTPKVKGSKGNPKEFDFGGLDRRTRKTRALTGAKDTVTCGQTVMCKVAIGRNSPEEPWASNTASKGDSYTNAPGIGADVPSTALRTV